MTQFAVLDALLVGAYESGISVADARGLGDFGIGCCDHLGGEVIFLDGEVFECTVGEPPDPYARRSDPPVRGHLPVRTGVRARDHGIPI